MASVGCRRSLISSVRSTCCRDLEGRLARTQRKTGKALAGSLPEGWGGSHSATGGLQGTRQGDGRLGRP